MYASQAVNSVSNNSAKNQVKLLKRKNKVLQSENDLIRKELKAMKELKKKDLNSSRASLRNNETEISRLTKQIAKLERFKKDVSFQKYNIFRLQRTN